MDTNLEADEYQIIDRVIVHTLSDKSCKNKHPFSKNVHKKLNRMLPVVWNAVIAYRYKIRQLLRYYSVTFIFVVDCAHIFN